MAPLQSKRETLQKLLDEYEGGWQIREPSPGDENDVYHICTVEVSDPLLEAEIIIPNSYFLYYDFPRIKKLVKVAIEQSKTTGK